MRLRIDQLPTHLSRLDLASVYCLTGDEPLQLLESADAIRHRARKLGVKDRTILNVDKNFDWGKLSRESANLSLFSVMRLIELRLGASKLGKQGSDALIKYTESSTSENNILIITTNKLDKQTQQSKWFKALERAGVIIQIWPFDLDQLPNWVMQRCKKMGKKINREAAELIAYRTEGNLLACKQELEKLSLLIKKDVISLDDTLGTVVDNTRYDAFKLIEHAFLGCTRRISEMLRGLQQEGAEPISLLGAIMWDYRRICSIVADISAGIPKEKAFATHRVWSQKQAAINTIINRYNQDTINRILTHAATLDRSLKGAIKQNAWELIENFLFEIAGITLQSSAWE